jgi:septal ring factor EnvC (AmiA/AmiB activator)
VAAGLALAAAASAEQGGDARLDRMREQAAQSEQRAKSLREEADVSLDGLEQIDRRLADTRREQRGLERRSRAAEQALAEARRELERSETELARVRGELDVRLVALYKLDAAGGRTAILRAQDVQQALFTMRGLTAVAEQDAALFDRYRAMRAEREARAESALRARAELQRTRIALAAQEELARRESVERRNLVSLLRSRAARESKAAQELREAAGRLEAALRDLPRRRGEAPPGPGLVQGRVPRPVPGAVRAPFGRQLDPEFKTQTVRNGIEIQADRGEPVRSVAPARVLFAGWFRGYGQVVILEHGAGKITVSGYLDEVEVEAGEQVSAGQVIGRVGDTGSLRGPGLYFELRDGGKAVDPTAWLE